MTEPTAADSLLGRSRALANDAGVEQVSIEGRFLLAWQAAVDLMNALITSSRNDGTLPRGTHVKRIELCRRLVPEASKALDGIDASRDRRNLIAYSGHGAETDVLERLVADIAMLDAVVGARLTVE